MFYANEDDRVYFYFNNPTGPNSDSVDLYNVIFWDKTDPCAFLNGAAFRPGNGPAGKTGSIGPLRGLTPGHKYFVAIEAWNKYGAPGFPTIARSFIAGGARPGPVNGLQLRSIDPTTQQLTWDAATNAAGYRLSRRNVNEPGSELAPLDGGVDDPCAVTAFNFPGTWNFE